MKCRNVASRVGSTKFFFSDDGIVDDVEGICGFSSFSNRGNSRCLREGGLNSVLGLSVVVLEGFRRAEISISFARACVMVI